MKKVTKAQDDGWEDIPSDGWEDIPSDGWEDIPTKVDPKTTAAESAIEGFGQTATAGYLPQIQAALYPSLEQLFMTPQQAAQEARLKAQGIESPEQTYVQRRDENIARQRAQAKQHPLATAAGQLGGAIAGGALMPQVKAAQGAGVLGRIGAAAKSGALAGAIYNPGDVEGEVSPVQPFERAKAAGLGAAGGAIFQTGVEGLKGAYRLGKNLVGQAGAYMAGMTPATATEYAKNPKKVDELAKMLKTGKEDELQDLVKTATNTAEEGLGDRFARESAALKNQQQGRVLELKPEEVLGKDADIDKIILDDIAKNYPNVSPLKQNPEFFDQLKNPSNLGMAPQGKPFIPTAAEPIVPEVAKVSAQAAHAAQSRADKLANWRNVGIVDPQAQAKQSVFRDLSTAMRGDRRAQLPDLEPFYEAERNAINLKEALADKTKNTPIATLLSDAPDTLALLKNIDTAGGSTLESLSRQLTAAKSVVPKGGNMIAATSAAVRPFGRGIVRATMSPASEKEALMRALAAISDAGMIAAFEGRRKE